MLNNNIKQFVEVSKANIDRLIISSHFDSHLTLNEIIRNVWVVSPKNHISRICYTNHH